MITTSWKKLVLPIIAGVALATVAILPQTGWLARPQMQAAIGLWPESERCTLTDMGVKSEDLAFSWLRKMPQSSAEVNTRQLQTLATHSDDIGMQIAGVLLSHPNTNELPKHLRQLVEKYPRSPEVYATLLRFACTPEASLNARTEDDILQSRPPDRSKFRPSPMDTALTEQFIQDAQQGEALDPQNAYFPFMRSLGLFSLKRDNEALAALHKAGQCTDFNEYISTEALGKLRLHEAMAGKQKALPELAYISAILFPHYASVRAEARLATTLAVQKEIAGDKNKGIAIRKDIITVAQKLQKGSSNFIGTLVGFACEQVAFSRPDGAPLIKSNEENPSTSEKERLFEKRAAQWRDYARKNNMIELAERPTQLRDEKERVNKWFRVGEEKSAVSTATLGTLTLRQVAASGLLTVGVMFLLLGGIANTLLRFTLLKEGKGAHPAALWGVAFGVITPIVVLIFLPLSGLICVPLAICLWKLRKAEGTLWKKFATFSLFALAPSALILTMMWLIIPGITLPMSLVGMWQGLSSDEPMSAFTASTIGVSGMLVFVIWSLPLWIMGIFAIVSRVKKIPASVGMARGISEYALPIASLLAIAFALAMPTLANQQDRLREQVREMATNEISLYKRLASTGK